MKPIILAIILASSISGSAFILNRNPEVDGFKERIERLEIDMAILQDRFDEDRHHAQNVIDEVREIVTTAYSHVIPISGGYLGVLSSPQQQEDNTRKGHASANQNP